MNEAAKPALRKRKKSGTTPASTSAMQIIQAAMAPDVSLSDLGKLAETDPGFAIRVLALVNSPAFGLSIKISDVRRAAATIGILGMRNLALSLVLCDMIPAGEAGQTLLAHSLRRAVAARTLGEFLKIKDTQTCFTTGMLLEVALLVRAKQDLTNTADLVLAPAEQRVLRERMLGQVPHPVQGSQVAVNFHVPKEIVTAILRHHDRTPPEGQIEKIAWVAEKVAGVFEGGEPIQLQKQAIEAVQSLGLSADKAKELLQNLPSLVLDAAGNFDRNVGQLAELDTLLVDANHSLVELNREYQSMVRQLEQIIEEKEILAQQLKQANEQLVALALLDPLTGLPNRRAFEQALTRELSYADREGTPIGMMMVDIDHFKKINDVHGHPIGDEALRVVGMLIRKFVRGSDIPARIGGEEFAVVLRNTEEEGAEIVADRVRKEIEAAVVTTPSGPLRMTASFGIAIVPGKGCRERSEELMKVADEALYQAKRGGRNRVIVLKTKPVLG